MNFCLTKIGARTLRASILQPPSTKNEIESRLECVSELIERSGTGATFVLRSILTKIQNVDQLLNVVTLISKQPQECSERPLNYLLLLNSFFEILEPLRECLREFKNPFYKEVADNLASPEFDYIKSLMRTVIVEDGRPAKGSNGSLQRCFAIKPGVNSLLDLVRKSYSERLDEMRMYVRNLGEKYNLPLTLSNNNTKGYHIVLPLKKGEKKSFKRSMLPNEFIQVDRLSGSFTMKTTDLINLSIRVEEIMMNILKISNIITHKTLVNIKERVAVFYKLCEDISKLDMLQSLAKLSGDTNYVRPKFDDYMEIKHGRHPILDFICSETPTSNSTIATDDHNVHIISGPNGSGKSIFIRQLVLIQVMAQVGCYVPAESATLRIADRILARISLDDNPDIGVSAFVLEILEVEYFLEVMSKNTLIVIDELCRSTSVEEGTALAMAICEKLAETPAIVFFTTHFKAMAILGDIYMNIKTWQMETIMQEKNGRIYFNFMYRLLEGMTTLENYGVHIAKSCWPDEPFNYALDVLNSTKPQQTDFPQSRTQYYLHLKYDLEADLRLLKKKRKLLPNILNDKLKEYQNSIRMHSESIQIQVDDLKSQNQSNGTTKIIEKSNLKECDSSEIGGAINNKKTSSSSGYVIQNTAKTSFGNSSPHNGDVPEHDQSFKSQIIQRSIDYDDITFSGGPTSSNGQEDNEEEEVDIRNVTFNWKSSQTTQNAIGNNCYDYLGLYQNDNFKTYFIGNDLEPSKNDENYSLPRDPRVVLSSSIHSSDVMDCDQTISELNKKPYLGDHQEFDECNNPKRQFKIPFPTKTSKRSDVQSKNDTSFSSVNEAQFSLQLSQNRNKTSTPLQKNKTMNNDTTYQCPEKDFIESESEYFSDFNWEESDKKNKDLTNNSNKKETLNRSSITINPNDSQKLNPQEMESIISELESVSEYFSDDEWNKETENINETNCVGKGIHQTYCEEYQVSSISYSPDGSILQDIIKNKPFPTICSDGDNNSGESLFRIEAKRKKIKVPFQTPKPFVKKVKRKPAKRRNNRDNKSLNEDKNLTDKKSSGTNQDTEKNSIKALPEAQTLEKSPSPKDRKENDNNKKIIVLQNIVIKPSTNFEIQQQIPTGMESKDEINFDNKELNQHRSSQQIKDQTNTTDEPITTEQETASFKINYIQSPKVYIAENEEVQEKELLIKKSNSLSSEYFFKIETNTTKRRKLGIREKRSEKLITELNTDQKSTLDTKKNRTPDDNKNTKDSIDDTKNYNSSSHEIYYSANESFHEVQKSLGSLNSSSLIEKDQNLSSVTVRTENVKKPPSSRILKRRKFISPLKLTRKEIKEEFEKQDRLMFENNCPETYLQSILNRPSIQSIQKSECVAMIYRTPEGTKVVTPPPNKKSKKSQLRRFLPPIIDKPIQTKI
ncbi:uncharacterized protein LOC108732555 [Agrilus planipennis]|uniref:Uncharacterized protein LOC108732555 n=1 Tax=Agrilus planipennis TaxID=224129 RepID=A0A1W4WFY7_AGRPL|nr:uncharacterized protein LOC108732555 [Agrilus planipennis]